MAEEDAWSYVDVLWLRALKMFPEIFWWRVAGPRSGPMLDLVRGPPTTTTRTAYLQLISIQLDWGIGQLSCCLFTKINSDHQNMIIMKLINTGYNSLKTFAQLTIDYWQDDWFDSEDGLKPLIFCVSGWERVQQLWWPHVGNRRTDTSIMYQMIITNKSVTLDDTDCQI